MVRAAMAHASEHHRPGEPPPIRDEAADTPFWLPVLGLCLLVLGALFVIWQSATAHDEAATAAPAAAPAGEEREAAPADGQAPAPAEPQAQ